MRYTTIKKISLCMLLAGSVACTDLETEFTDSVPVVIVGGVSTGDPGDLLATAYNKLNDHIGQDNIMALLEHPSDEMIGPTRGTDWGDNGIWRSLHQHTWDPTHQYVTRAWNNLNSAVFVCNQILGSSPTAEQAAQAKFLRAFNMFYVVDLYGVVPFREIDEGVDVDPKVMSRTEAFDFIVKDLTEALPDLDAGGPGVNPGVVNKGAANALLARLYLNKAVYTATEPAGPYNFEKADMDKVIEYCDAVMDMGYALEENYFRNFKDSTTTEKIFVADKGVTSPPDAYYYMGIHYNQPPKGQGSGGWNGFTTLSDFYNKFDNGDVRLGPNPAHGFGFLVGPQTNAAGEPVNNRRGSQLTYTEDINLVGNNDEAGIRVVKYYPEVISQGPDAPGIATIGSLVLLRYADVHLMKIEAILRGGSVTNGQSAQGMLDELRDLRGVASIPASLDIVLDERGRELYYERVRRTDQIRFGTFTSTWEGKTVTDKTRVLFPIPQQALDSNPNLQPNPGY
ncbi:RagB/SusD family nutrient uptake outer membrane protein [Fulvivirga ligni]|uniref:RagB/SusD family nutrient uptake outer membrane protein n=1 Tax=Fulvivirga ligni TaxID=2904246 RepID=UPI001F1F455B|nr:RagB/SusD family nutrient uptake outer membrane protein [Fulvivirga ligni]UII19529.1 RagB/SusD family nutrient uptake outer membrane protein [Fulvivirga ligni]